MSDEPKISERYRELSPEEPPRHLDDAILAAARRAAGTRPAPLVVPTGRQRWYFPLAAAAIIVLAVAVTVHVERHQPDSDAEEIQPPPAKPEPPRVFAPDPKPTQRRNEQNADERAGSRDLRAQRETPPPTDLQKATPQSAPAPSPPQDTVGRASESARADTEARAAARSRQAAPSVQEAPALPPEQALQGIADLRRQGKHDEADQALAEFRKRYPDYKISAEMLEKVEKR